MKRLKQIGAAMMLALAVAMLPMQLMTGCATVTGDPLMVRTEQIEATSLATFQAALNLDNSDREFYRANAPAFHSACEWLREPVTLSPTNTLPRGAAMLWSLDQTKLAYRAGRASSNAVAMVLAPLETALTQVQAHLAITQPPGMPAAAVAPSPAH